MTTATESHTEHTIEVAGLALRYLKGGAGDAAGRPAPLDGEPGWIPFYERLAERASVYVPDMPGYGQSARPEWAREPRDLAILLLQALPRLGLRARRSWGSASGASWPPRWRRCARSASAGSCSSAHPATSRARARSWTR